MTDDDGLGALDEMLFSVPMEDEGMLQSEFDGLCTGLIVCPEMILPSECFPISGGRVGRLRSTPMRPISTR